MTTGTAKKDCSQINWESTPHEWVKDNWTWVFPQLCSFVGRLPLVAVDGVISPKQTAHKLKELSNLYWPNGTAISSDSFKAIWRLLQTVPRGTILGGTQNGNSSRYNSGVPLILSCWREHRGVQYSSWDWTDPAISAFVDRDVLNLVEDLTSLELQDDLVELREAARLVKTGVKSGSLRSLTSVVPFGGLGSEGFQGLRRLAKYCVTQTWIYHPSVRHPYQICGADLDHHPAPLVSDEVTVAMSNIKQLVLQPDNPFDL